MSLLAVALGCVGAITAAGGQSGRPVPLPLVPVTRLDDRGGARQLDAPHGVSLTFARPLAVRDVLLLLFRNTPFSVVVDPAVSSTFVGELKDLTLRQALESVLTGAASDYDVDGTIVRVFPRKPEMRLFGIDHLHSSPEADFLGDAGAGVQSLLSASGRLNVNRKASLIQVTDFADRLELVASYIETAQLRVSRQVRIDARVFEVARPDGRPVDWPALAARPGSGVRKIGGAAGWRVDDVEALFAALGGIAAVRQLAAPAMLAMNNEPAVLRVEHPESEIRLSITPQISATDVIHMRVAPFYAGRGRNSGADGLFTASVDTTLRIASGDTVVIAGVMRQREDGTLSEVVVLLTPTRVSASAAAVDGGR